jgi:hypothetical protein
MSLVTGQANYMQQQQHHQQMSSHQVQAPPQQVLVKFSLFCHLFLFLL